MRRPSLLWEEAGGLHQLSFLQKKSKMNLKSKRTVDCICTFISLQKNTKNANLIDGNSKLQCTDFPPKIKKANCNNFKRWRVCLFVSGEKKQGGRCTGSS